MKFLYTLIITGIAVSFTSCSTTYRSKSSDYQFITKAPITQVPKIAEFKVEKIKATGKYSGSYKRKNHSNSLREAKEMALGDAILQAKCDFLIHPLYDVKIEGRTINVSVNGYPAHYTKFRTFIMADTTLLQNGQAVPVNATENSLLNKFTR